MVSFLFAPGRLLPTNSIRQARHRAFRPHGRGGDPRRAHGRCPCGDGCGTQRKSRAIRRVGGRPDGALVHCYLSRPHAGSRSVWKLCLSSVDTVGGEYRPAHRDDRPYLGQRRIYRAVFRAPHVRRQNLLAFSRPFRTPGREPIGCCDDRQNAIPDGRPAHSTDDPRSCFGAASSRRSTYHRRCRALPCGPHSRREVCRATGNRSQFSAYGRARHRGSRGRRNRGISDGITRQRCRG